MYITEGSKVTLGVVGCDRGCEPQWVLLWDYGCRVIRHRKKKIEKLGWGAGVVVKVNKAGIACRNRGCRWTPSGGKWEVERQIGPRFLRWSGD